MPALTDLGSWVRSVSSSFYLYYDVQWADQELTKSPGWEMNRQPFWQEVKWKWLLSPRRKLVPSGTLSGLMTTTAWSVLFQQFLDRGLWLSVVSDCFKSNGRVSKLAPWVKVITANPGHLSWNLRTHDREGAVRLWVLVHTFLQWKSHKPVKRSAALCGGR